MRQRRLMRAYGRRYLRNLSRRISEARSIEIAAIVYDVSPSTRTCRVKIQGSDTAIVCTYNEGYQSPPIELKAGQAVRLEREGGIRGRMRVVGLGQVIPTGVTYPPTPSLIDMVLQGQVLALPDIGV